MNRDRQNSGRAGSPIAFDRSRTAGQTTADGTRSRQRPPAPGEEGDERENPYAYTIEKPHTSALRYVRVPPRRSATLDHTNPKKTRLIRQRRPFLVRFLVVLGLGLLVLALGIMAFNAFSNWWQLHTDDVTYGRPRTYQTDQYVGHGDSPAHPNHFIALNLNGVVEVIEINAQHIQLDHAYYITTTDPLNPVTLTFPTVDGKQYMYISIGDSSNAYTVAMVNDGKEFTGVQH